MRYYSDYEMEVYWEDNDNQDGTYFREYEGTRNEDYRYNSERDMAHEERKHRAALYIRAHFTELMKDEAYRKAYYKLIDELERDLSYYAYDKPLFSVSDEDRESRGGALDIEISVKGKKRVETYKDDAIYIVDWVRAGKDLIVYID